MSWHSCMWCRHFAKRRKIKVKCFPFFDVYLLCGCLRHSYLATTLLIRFVAIATIAKWKAYSWLSKRQLMQLRQLIMKNIWNYYKMCLVFNWAIHDHCHHISPPIISGEILQARLVYLLSITVNVLFVLLS